MKKRETILPKKIQTSLKKRPVQHWYIFSLVSHGIIYFFSEASKQKKKSVWLVYCFFSRGNNFCIKERKKLSQSISIVGLHSQ